MGCTPIRLAKMVVGCPVGGAVDDRAAAHVGYAVLPDETPGHNAHVMNLQAALFLRDAPGMPNLWQANRGKAPFCPAGTSP
jgi:hypothetical protein